MQRVFTSDLSLKGLRELKKSIRNYKNVTLNSKVAEFTYELADVGISIARLNRGDFKPYIGFIKEVKDTKYHYQSTVLVVGMNVMPNVARWWKDGQVHEAEVNSIMMAEFGSGKYAMFGYRGTFPNQTHAFDDNGWKWTPVGGNGTYDLMWSDGVEPTRPMYYAWVAMKLQIESIARKVFDRS